MVISQAHPALTEVEIQLALGSWEIDQALDQPLASSLGVTSSAKGKSVVPLVSHVSPSPAWEIAWCKGILQDKA